MQKEVVYAKCYFLFSAKQEAKANRTLYSTIKYSVYKFHFGSR